MKLIENFSRFLLEHLHKEEDNLKKQEEPNHTNVEEFRPKKKKFLSEKSCLITLSKKKNQIVQKLFSSLTVSYSKCSVCKHETSREVRNVQYSLDPLENMSFTEVLRTSLLRETQTKAWCEKCNK